MHKADWRVVQLSHTYKFIIIYTIKDPVCTQYIGMKRELLILTKSSLKSIRKQIVLELELEWFIFHRKH